MQEVYVRDISTRSVDDLVRAAGMEGICKNQVSRLWAEIDSQMRNFLDRPIEGDRRYLLLDATYVKVREVDRIVSIAVTIAVEVKGYGRPEVLGMAIDASEVQTSWTDFLRGFGPARPARR